MIDTPWPAGPFEFGEVLRLALALFGAILVSEALRRFIRLPRIAGYALAGLLMGPMGLGWFAGQDMLRFRMLIDLALALLLFELGVQVNLRWLRTNLWVVAGSLLESGLAFAAVFGLLRFVFHVDGKLSAVIAAIAMGTSPAVVMRVAAELQAQGQVSQRILVMTALNTAYAIIASKLIIGGLHGAFREDWVLAVMHPLYLVLGSFGMGAALAIAFKLLRRHFDFSDEQGGALLFALLLLTLAALEALNLPSGLAPLVGGIMVKFIDPRPHLWPRYFGTAGAVLFILLFVLTGAAVTWHDLLIGGGMAGALLLVRGLAKGCGVVAFGPLSGLSLKQSLLVGAALSPMAAMALLLVQDVRLIYPAFGDKAAAVVLTLMVVLEIVGAIAVQWALHKAGETREGGR
ncbi:MAG: cation:proton antiporter [Betaproteobacteria bacterium]|nr:cation:proton antiporter [Betaproteobacteria bacterium]